MRTKGASKASKGEDEGGGGFEGFEGEDEGGLKASKGRTKGA